MTVAAEHHWEPSRLWTLSEQDQAFLIAHYRAKSTIAAYQDHLHAKQIAAQNKKKK